MFDDPIVAEVRKARRQMVEKAGGGLHRLCEMLKAKQGKNVKVAQPEPRRGGLRTGR